MKYLYPNDRIGVFWAGGSTTGDDFDNVDEFIESYIADKGKVFSNVLDIDFFQKLVLSESNKDKITTGGEPSTGHPSHSPQLLTEALRTCT